MRSWSSFVGAESLLRPAKRSLPASFNASSWRNGQRLLLQAFDSNRCGISTRSPQTKPPSPRSFSWSTAMSATSHRCRRVSELSGSGGPQHRHGPRVEHDAVGHAAATAHRRASGHQYPQHVIAALARLAEAGEPLLGPCQQLRRVRAGAKPGDEEEGCRLVRPER